MDTATLTNETYRYASDERLKYDARATCARFERATHRFCPLCCPLPQRCWDLLQRYHENHGLANMLNMLSASTYDRLDAWSVASRVAWTEICQYALGGMRDKQHQLVFQLGVLAVAVSAW